MFGWFKRKAQLSIIRLAEQDIDRFIAGLRGMDSDSIGLIVACATDWRHKIEAEKRWNLLDPIMLGDQLPLAAWQVNHLIRQVQKETPALATGLMVWLHTLRAAHMPELRVKGRQMWGELRRGFPHASTAAADAYLFVGFAFDVTDCDRVPATLEPEIR